MDAATLIREARTNAGLSQAELAKRAGTAQPAVSAYEAGIKDPTFTTLVRLLEAAGVRLRPEPLHQPTPPDDPGGLRRLLAMRRDEILRVAEEYGASNVRIFGSVARGDHTAASDIDLLVDLPLRRLLLNAAGLSARLSELLGVRVDVTTPRLLREEARASVLQDSVPL